MERRISTFLEEKGFDIKRRRKGQTIVDTLKDFFESENCINVNDAEDTINLHFDVFMLKEPNEIPNSSNALTQAYLAILEEILVFLYQFDKVSATFGYSYI